MKKNIIISSVIVILCLMTFFIFKSNKAYVFGTTVGNKYNGSGIATKVEDSLYFCWEDALYSVSECNEVKKISDYNGISLNYYDGWILMACTKTTKEKLGCEILKVSEDGTEYQKIDIPGDLYVYDMVIIDGKIYYYSDGLYCMDMDGENIKKVKDSISDREFMWLLISDKVKEIEFPNGYTHDGYMGIYRTHCQENEEWIYLYKWKEEDYDDSPENVNNTMLSSNAEVQWYPRDLYCISHDYNKHILIDNNITAYNIDDEFIYYIKNEDENTSSVWKADLDGSNKVRINEIKTEEDTWGYSIFVSNDMLMCLMIHWVEDVDRYPTYVYFVNTDGSDVVFFDDNIAE